MPVSLLGAAPRGCYHVKASAHGRRTFAGSESMRGVAIVLAGAGLIPGGLLAYWFVRPNSAFINPSLELETWDIVTDGSHNSNTDLIYWKDSFYLVHQTSPYHFCSERSKLIIRKSTDAHSWEKVTEFQVPGGELRDPKFAAIGGRLFVYALRNVRWTAEPHTTLYTFSDDGTSWRPFVNIEPRGWLFWRPKTRDATTWYVPAYWHEHGKSILLESNDGISWSTVSRIYEGERNDETAVEFLPDGRMIATSRLEGSGSIFGDTQASTLVAVASPPYKDWARTKSRVTRLDGPRLFPYGGKVFAVGRYQANRMPALSEQGSIFGKKRTSLFLVEEEGLTYLSDLPSAGDTSYAGAVVLGDALYVCYYTSPIDRDYPWILGMFAAADIRMAKMSLRSLAALAQRSPAMAGTVFPPVGS